MKYSTTNDRLLPTWTLVTGTGRTGYADPTVLSNNDPSDSLWIAGDTLRIAGDFGSAMEIVAVFVFAHTLDQSIGFRLQAHTSNVWTSPALSLAIPILAPMGDGFTCHAMLDLRTSTPAAIDRTYQFISLANVDAGNVADTNSKSISIGEVWVVSGYRQLIPVDLDHKYTMQEERLMSANFSKRGVQFTYDLGSRNRGLAATLRTTGLTGYDTVFDWIAAQKGAVAPMVTVLDDSSLSRRLSEPRLVRFVDANMSALSGKHQKYYDFTMNFKEVGQGEPVDA